jgi:ferritin-like protein
VTNKILPRNLTARAAYNVPGNPPSTRTESGVSNCYPGLEYDHRNLDRRFFPGLVFEFVSQDDASAPEAARQGALLRAVDPSDPGLVAPAGLDDVARVLGQQLAGGDGRALSATGARWYLSSITQTQATLRLDDEDGVPLDGLTVWRLVRSLRPGPVTLHLERRDPPGAPAITLGGWRRRYTDQDTGVLSPAYAPGELTQSLCSPWMHDFRDCGCTYWASNHPDIVLAEVALDEAPLPAGSPDAAIRGDLQIDWLRADRDGAAASAVGSRGEDATQMSHFEINRRWQDLAIVLEGREIGDLYVPRSRGADNARPYASPAELRDQLQTLASLEHLVALLYLYARYSVVTPSEAQAAASRLGLPTLVDDAAFARHVLLDVAVGEMQHLRRVNQILWHLFEARVVPGWDVYEPSVTRPALVIPAAGAFPATPAALQPLTPATQALFVAIEEPSSFIDGRYARATATLLRASYPPHLHDLASAIARDGEQHYLRFRDMQTVLAAYSADTYLRPIVPGSPQDPQVQAALDAYASITRDLFAGYQRGDPMNLKSVAASRASMFVLDHQAEELARRNVGVPFLSLFGS